MSSLQGSTSLTVIQIKKHKLPHLAFYMLSRDWAQAPRLGRQLPVLTELHPHLVFLYVPFTWGLRLVAVRDMGFSLSFLRDSPEGKGDSTVTGETGISLQLEKTELLQTHSSNPHPPASCPHIHTEQRVIPNHMVLCISQRETEFPTK